MVSFLPLSAIHGKIVDALGAEARRAGDTVSKQPTLRQLHVGATKPLDAAATKEILVAHAAEIAPPIEAGWRNY